MCNLQASNLTIMATIYIVSIVVLILIVIALYFRLDQLRSNMERIEASVKSEISLNREESGRGARHAREEMTNSLRSFGELISRSMNSSGELQKNQLETFSANLDKLTRLLDQKIENLNGSTTLKMDQMRDTIERKVNELQQGNEKKLEEMRATVDEKLQKTLETRLTESFRQVSERLEAVHKGLGDMQQLATGVGDLKKVLTNVKSRGVLGEYQLQNLIEQLFTPDQYSRNVKTKEGSGHGGVCH